MMIKTEHLYKKYQDKVVLDDLSMELDSGDICGLIGANGSGKTILLRILATLIKPTSGVVIVNGYNAVSSAAKVKSFIGYVPEIVSGYENLKVWEYLDFFAAAYRLDRNYRTAFITDLLELTDLKAHREIYIQHLSRGLKQRLCLAKTLLHDPSIFLLDEPATGIDAKGRIELRELLLELGAMGKTVVIASNILSDLDEICNKVGFLNNGRLIAFGEIGSVLKQMNIPRVVEIKVLDAVDKAQTILKERDDIANVKVKNNILAAEYIGNPQEVYEVLNALVDAEIKVLAFHENMRRLENAFLALNSNSRLKTS
ncbi:ABC transporter ATP-binding protein [Candidatus Poribacteria bacterium]|nr:ABC transporter ATP-binding protein [Candidatus Poribacteria bacterium]